MNWFKDTIHITTQGKGLYPFSQMVETLVRQWGIQEGMCFLYLPHTSASLVINENYDPSARVDLEAFMEHIAPENQPWHQHTLEGRDDSPSHMRAMITPTSLTIPIDNGRLSLGAWQGIFLYEHRSLGHQRKVLVRGLGMD